MRRSLSIGGSSTVQWRKVWRSWRLRMCYHHLLCVRIETDQLQCVNCWVIILCLSASCTKINHLRCALVIWSSLQLTSKQWIITQQFTARADLFLKCKSHCSEKSLIYSCSRCQTRFKWPCYNNNKIYIGMIQTYVRNSESLSRFLTPWAAVMLNIYWTKVKTLHLNCLPSIYKIMQTKIANENVS